TSTQFQANFASAATIQSSVVFGTEKPRLLINESYSEVVNDPTDMFGDPMPPVGAAMGPTKPVHVRFWLELMNPTSIPYGSTLGPLGDGGVNLLYEQVQDSVPATYTQPTYSPYQIIILNNNGNKAFTAAQALRDPTNSRGDLSLGGAPVNADIKVDLSNWSN